MRRVPALPASWNAADDDAARPFIRLLFAAARLAYEPPNDGLAGFRGLGLDPTFIERRSTQAYAARAGADGIVAFRGTERAVGDILTDLKFIRRHTPDGAVHSGFWEAYDRVHDDVAGFAASVAGDGGRLWLTGHSLGGALAVVAAYRLTLDNAVGTAGAPARHAPREKPGDTVPPIGGVVTFGQPMVVMPRLAGVLESLLPDRSLGFVNGRDLVPNLVRPYVHFGQLVVYRQGRFERQEIRPRAAATAPADVVAPAGPPPLLEPLDDAALDAVIAQLEDERTGMTPRDGRQMRSMFPWAVDHSLAAYAALVDAFVARVSP